MYKYNDCISLTRDYLKNLSYREQALKNIEVDITELEKELDGVPVKIAKYSEAPGGGTSELNEVELQASLREKRSRELSELKASKSRLENHIKKIKASLACLPADARELITLVYVDRLSYARAGEQLGMSERTCRRRGLGIVSELASIFFGASAYEPVYFMR